MKASAETYVLDGSLIKDASRFFECLSTKGQSHEVVFPLDGLNRAKMHLFVVEGGDYPGTSYKDYFRDTSLLVLCGSGALHLMGRSHVLRPGLGYYVPANVEYIIEADSEICLAQLKIGSSPGAACGY